jgi:hypothetical protein
MAVAALLPRARFGLRNDVFSGLLLFEMLNSFEAPQISTAVPSQPVESKPLRQLSTQKAVPQKREGEKPRLKAPPAGKSEQSVSETPISGVNEVLARIARDDLTIAAALIDVRVLQESDSLKLDFSNAAKAAEIALTGARAGGILESAFGLAPEGNYGESGPATNPGNGAAASLTTAPGATSPIEAISARLGADILISRRLDAEDNDTGDIEDEQF